MKMAGGIFSDPSGEGLRQRLSAPEKCTFIKAVDNESGEIMGSICWGFRGRKKEEVPKVPESALVKEVVPVDEVKEPETKIIILIDENEEPEVELPADHPCKRFVAMTEWMAKLMPEGTKCMFVIGLSVAPKFQGTGVGSALLKWGTDEADKAGVFAWVHSSEMGSNAYRKAGFEVIGTLDIDLDEWAVAPPDEEPAEGEEVAKWGHYVLRWMKRLPKEQ